MNMAASVTSVPTTNEQLHHCLAQQQAFAKQQGIESYDERRQHLQNLKALINDNRDDILAAINLDYGNRSYHETILAEFLPVTDDINSTLKHLKKWMKVQKRQVDHSVYFAAKNRVIPQPLGVVGLIIPWNFPINLTFCQLSAAFAAGNKAMVKMSENSRHLSKLLGKLASQYFAKEKLQFFCETGSVGIAFSQLPFDHLMFTGSCTTGKKVMASAASNLTPVSLELGGKSPAILDPNYPVEKAVERLMFVKQFNAGQICTNVDYAFIHENSLNKFIEAVKVWVKKHVPDINSKDYTAIIDHKAFTRLSDAINEAQQKGATIINLNNQPADENSRKFPLTLVINSNDDMSIDQRETFGPILMIKTYSNPQQVIDYITARDKPLALYPFSNDKELIDKYINTILSGGVSVNDALFHVGQHDLPFGGVGASGMGHYHGYEGFLTFSKLRPIFYQANFSFMRYLAPPYGTFADKVLSFLSRLKS